MKKIICMVLAIVMLLGLSGCGGAGPEGMSLEEYNKIYIGMSIDDVEDLVGGKSSGTVSSEKQDGVTIYTYRFEGEKSGYALLTCIFGMKDGKYHHFEITKKEQFDLK